MGNALPKLAAVTLCLSLSAGCVSRGEPGPAFPDNYSGQGEAVGNNSPTAGPGGSQFGNPQFGNHGAKPSAWDGFVSAVTDNPVTRGFKSAGKSTAEAMTISPQEDPAYDPVSLNSRPPKADPEMYVSMARVQESNGNMEGAEEMFQKALSLNKRYLPALIGLGEMRFRQQRHDEALAIFTQARKIDPQNLEAILGQAHFHDTRENMPEATRLYSEATQRQPRVARTWNDLGLCLARQRRLAESQQTLEKAVQLEPGNVLYRNNLATVLVELKRPDEALAHLQQAHGQAAGHYNLGFLLHRRGENQAAAEQFQFALRVDPEMEAAKLWLNKLNSENNVQQRASSPPAGRSAALLRGPDGHSLHLYTKQQAFARRPPSPPRVEHLVSDGPADVIQEENESPATHIIQASAAVPPAITAEPSLKQESAGVAEDKETFVVPVAVEISDYDEKGSASNSEIAHHRDQHVRPAYEANTTEEASQEVEIDAETAAEPPRPAGFELDLTQEHQEPAKFTPVLIQPALVTGEAAQTLEPVADPILPAPRFPVLEKAEARALDQQPAPLPSENALLGSAETDNAELDSASNERADIQAEAEAIYEE